MVQAPRSQLEGMDERGCELHTYDMPNAEGWNIQNTFVSNDLNEVPGEVAEPGVSAYYG